MKAKILITYITLKYIFAFTNKSVNQQIKNHTVWKFLFQTVWFRGKKVKQLINRWRGASNAGILLRLNGRYRAF